MTCGTAIWPAFSYAFTARYELKSDDLEGGNPWDFGLIENVITLGNSTDFGLHLGVVSRF